MNETIEFVVKLRGGAQAASEAQRLSSAVGAMGGKVRAVGRESSLASRSAEGLGRGIRRAAFALVALGAGYRAWSAAKGAISYTKDLAEATGRLSRATGMNVEMTSRYVGVAGALGISSQALGTSFAKLAKQAEIQAAGTGKSVTAFDRLGITTQWVRKHHDDFNAIAMKTIDRLHAMHGGTAQLRVGTELLGKGWQTLNPLFGEGSAHLEKMLGLAKKYGVELHGGMTKELAQLKEAQLESTLASDGLRISFTKMMAGPLLGLMRSFARLKNDIRTGNWKDFDRQIGKSFDVLSRIVEDFQMRAIETFGQTAPKLLKAFWHGFQHASFGNQALVAGILLTKMGLTGAAFGAVGRLLGRRLAGGFLTKVPEMAAAGTAMGTAFEVAFGLAAIAGVAIISYKAGMLLRKVLGLGGTEYVDPSGMPLSHADIVAEEKRNAAKRRRDLARQRGHHLHPQEGPHHLYRKTFGKGATGGTMLTPGMVEVGERGPEILNVPGGSQIAPLTPGSLRDERPIIIQVSGRELARVNRRETLQSQAAGA